VIATRPAPPQTRFVLPDGLQAATPPEHRGIARDGVRLLVARRAGVSHHRFHELAALLEPGDLLVVNTSATLPAALTGHRPDGSAALVHVAGWLDTVTWIVELRRADNRGAEPGLAAGNVVHLPAGVTLTLRRPHPDQRVRSSRLWVADVTPPTGTVTYLAGHGKPIAYSHHMGSWALSDHQNVYADEPGSAEMASAGRPFTLQLLMLLMAAGVTIAPVTLHSGVSSAEFREPPAPERYAVPESTARLAGATRAAGRRVVAVGTTVVRALETVADADGAVHQGRGWTELVLSPQRPPRVINGLITGLHLPESSHLLLLEAVAGPTLVSAAYEAAVEMRYLWHEFGDSMLFLP
jgi:S-adenosylmethionine:tRNA ribosyltransferase-isomerase